MSGSTAYEVRQCVTGISLLANNFNRLFVTAWTSGADYLCILHSDIGTSRPAGYGGSWLELLVDRLRENNLAALSAVVPIKSMDGLTSTALQLRKDSPHVLRRLSMQELHRLQDKVVRRHNLCDLFDISRDEAGALYINTGTLAIDLRGFDWAGARWPGFQITDYLAWNTNHVPMAYVDPEDWGFSRWLHQEGWPYAATKELIIEHHGEMAFSSGGNWGAEKDSLPPVPSIADYEAT
jgi:hypothetical protein